MIPPAVNREVIAAILSVLYLLLAIRQQISCWIVAFVSSCLYVWVYFDARLFMESLLSVFYAIMAIYGFIQWRAVAGGASLAVSRWPLRRHALGFAATLVMSIFTSYALRRFTPAAWPFIDSMITWASVYATFLVARKVYENWYWWLVIDSVAVVVYYARHLYPTLGLFVLYLLLIAPGMRAWRRELPVATHVAV
jgi:nicotinamide mononucleotide transporter